MDCRESRDLMSGAVDKQLLHDDSDGFYRHIEICGSCRDEYELEKLTKAYLKRKITFVDVPDDVEHAIMVQLTSNVQQMKKPGFISRLIRNVIFQPILAVGVVALSALLLFFANKPSLILPSSQETPSSTKEIQRDVLSLAETKFQAVLSGKFKPKITAININDVESYINQNAGYAIHFPAVANVDWIGGDVSNFADSKIAQVVYKIGESYIYLSSFPESAVDSKAISIPDNCAAAIKNNGWYWGQNSDGDTQAAWGTADHVCIVTSNLGKTDLIAYLKPPHNNNERKP